MGKENPVWVNKCDVDHKNEEEEVEIREHEIEKNGDEERFKVLKENGPNYRLVRGHLLAGTERWVVFFAPC